MYPRRFDIYGSSHQIMHVLVVCDAFSHMIGLVKAFDYWQGLQSSLKAKTTEMNGIEG